MKAACVRHLGATCPQHPTAGTRHRIRRRTEGVAMSAVPDFPAANDPDSLETQEWLDALEAVMEREGTERAHYLLEKLIDKARRLGAYLPYKAQTAYLNTIPPHMEERSPGDAALEDRILSLIHISEPTRLGMISYAV